jgi:thymidylate synthase (FAD)
MEDLRWKKFPCGSDGYICLVDSMGDDSSVVQAARTSYGAGTKKVSDDRNLIRYLYRHGHTTPFEMVEIKFLARVPMDAWRQWIRHRTANVNEYSTRYSEAIDSCEKVTEWRKQATTNKQGSDPGFIDSWPEGFKVPGYLDPKSTVDAVVAGPGAYLSLREQRLQAAAREVYEERLTFGVAREQARKDLPLSNYTEAYWKCDLRNILNFLSLRMDAHAQQEIRTYAEAMYTIVKSICPLSVEAFDEYDTRRGGLLLTATEIRLLKYILEATTDYKTPVAGEVFRGVVWSQTDWTAKSRELAEAEVKFKRLGLITND